TRPAVAVAMISSIVPRLNLVLSAGIAQRLYGVPSSRRSRWCWGRRRVVAAFERGAIPGTKVGRRFVCGLREFDQGGIGAVALRTTPGDREGARASVRRDGPADIRQPGEGTAPGGGSGAPAPALVRGTGWSALPEKRSWPGLPSGGHAVRIGCLEAWIGTIFRHYCCPKGSRSLRVRSSVG